VAQQAGRAAPAVAIAGALVAAPQAQHAFAAAAAAVTVTAQGPQAAAMSPQAHVTTATLDSIATQAVTVTSVTTARHTAAKSTYYRVRSGDSLSAIADRYYHNADDWGYVYHENDKTVSNPNLIYVGQRLFIPATVPAHYKLADYMPRHAKAPQPTAPLPTAALGSTGSQGSTGSGEPTSTGDRGIVFVQPAPQGMYNCSGLEQLWDQAGGDPADSFMAAEIAMAESGGNPNAISPTDDYGLWQINASNGSLATLDPFDNAKSAIILSDDGTNWNAWTTYHSGAYYGQC
jgi:LysM repeat protein